VEEGAPSPLEPTFMLWEPVTYDAEALTECRFGLCVVCALPAPIRLKPVMSASLCAVRRYQSDENRGSSRPG
jgi:hypothetical protein